MGDATERDSVLELYRMAIRNMLAGDKPGVVPNSSYRHASIIVEELARCAKLRFYAYCEKLGADVWTQPVIDQLQLAIQRGVDVQFVLAGSPEFEPPAFLKDRIRILRFDGTVDDNANLRRIDHFAVADGKSLRLEKNQDTREALFAANQPQVASELDAIFSGLRERAA